MTLYLYRHVHSVQIFVVDFNLKRKNYTSQLFALRDENLERQAARQGAPSADLTLGSSFIVRDIESAKMVGECTATGASHGATALRPVSAGLLAHRRGNQNS
jgi:hypothetical protein